jgi:hypothetical protein
MCRGVLRYVLGAGAGAERRRAKHVGPAGEVSCAGG